MKSYFQLLQSITEAPKSAMTWNRYSVKTTDGKVADWIEVAFESNNKRFLIKKHKRNSVYELFDRRHPKTSFGSYQTLDAAKKGAEFALEDDPRTEWHPSLREGSHDFGEDWSKEYKRSINCNNPKGFSQRAHCQGRKKR